MSPEKREWKSQRLTFENVGWTLGNECPFRCKQCYSMATRIKGRDLTKENVDRIIDQLAINGTLNVNLGGNEPLYTNGLNTRKTLLPYIIQGLANRGLRIGLTSAGVSVNYLAEHDQRTFTLLNDIDVSLDSPFPAEHNENRGAQLYSHALSAIESAEKAGIEHTIIMCGMNWNLSDRHLGELVKLAKVTNSNVRINFLKPTEQAHLKMQPTPEQFYRVAVKLTEICQALDLGEPLLAAILGKIGDGCPCGVKSFRINSITPDGKVPISPCVYMHDFRVGDLLKENLFDILQTQEFEAFRRRHENPSRIPGCSNCRYLEHCRGGCAARAYYSMPVGERTLLHQDPFCYMYSHHGQILPCVNMTSVIIDTSKVLVHRNYLCTLILKPR